MFLDANKKVMPCVHRDLFDVTPFQSLLSVHFLSSITSRHPAGCRFPLCAVWVLLALLFGSSAVVHTSRRGAWSPPVQTGACDVRCEPPLCRCYPSVHTHMLSHFHHV